MAHASVRKLSKIIYALACALSSVSCQEQDTINQAYVHYAPEKYTSKKTPIYLEAPYNSTIHDIYNAVFNDFLIIGKAAFTTTALTKEAYLKYGKKVGAELVIVSFSNRQEKVRFIRTKIPDKEEISEENETGSFNKKPFSISDEKDQLKNNLYSGNKTQTKTVYKYVDQPYVEIHYDQTVFFLRKTTGKSPWEYSHHDFCTYPPTTQDLYVGNWINYQSGQIKICLTDQEYIGFIVRDKTNSTRKEKRQYNKRLKWQKGNIAFRFNKDTHIGWYLGDDKRIRLIHARINRFNHLELLNHPTGEPIMVLQKSTL